MSQTIYGTTWLTCPASQQAFNSNSCEPSTGVAYADVLFRVTGAGYVIPSDNSCPNP